MSRTLRSVGPPVPGAVRRWVAREFAAIARTNPDLRRLDRQLAGLYLIPEEERWSG